MSTNQSHPNEIAPEDQYQIICPYCFNEVSDGDNIGNQPFSHTAVHFRAETYFKDERAVEQKLGVSKLDIEMMPDSYEREQKEKNYEQAECFVLKQDEKYQAFWDSYDKQTTEQEDRLNQGPRPWELPIIQTGRGIAELIADDDGFVTAAVDVYGRITRRRVCPFCHNPLPLGYGKNSVKYISIIGITGAGKTVYISQLLKGMMEYAAKAGLSAFFTSSHEANFIEDNPVAEGVPLPGSTSPNRLSQPMFYDIVQSDGQRKREDTIVLYDIAGENCRKAEKMVNFAKFVQHSNGIILLIDPKQLKLLVSDDKASDTDAPSLALNTLHAVLETHAGRKSKVPMAICISKGDQCFNILPPIAQDPVQYADRDENGMPTKEFDGKSYNQLERDLTQLMQKHALPVCNILENNYWNFNFFSVSAIGCECGMTEKGIAPLFAPTPRRIEEPILWLFKQFGFIRSNVNVYRPFKIKRPSRLVSKRKLFKTITVEVDDGYATYEEDPIDTARQ